MSNLKQYTTIGTVVAIVNDMTRDWGLDSEVAISAPTMLAADLQFASVDIIQLCVALEQCYGRRFGFQDLLMKDGSYIGDLSLSQFATFIDSKLGSEGTQP